MRSTCSGFGGLAAQEAAPRRHVEEQIAHLDQRALWQRRRPHLARSRHRRRRSRRPAAAPCCREVSRSRATEAMDGSASPRKPSDLDRGQVIERWRSCWWHGASAPAAVPRRECRSRCRGRGSGRRRRARSRPRCAWRRRRGAFSTSSLMTEAGRSTTSPAAIWSMRWEGKDADGHARRILPSGCPSRGTRRRERRAIRGLRCLR